MSHAQASDPASDQRRLRDDRSPPLGPPPATLRRGEPELPTPASSQAARTRRYADNLNRGFRGLRFTPEVEDEFQIDTCPAHWKRLIVGTIIGQASIWITVPVTLNLHPQIRTQTILNWSGCTLLALILILICLRGIAPERRRAWHMDIAAALPAIVCAALIVWADNAAPTLWAAAHGANLVLVGMWACILMRFRFRWAMLVSWSTFVLAFGLKPGSELGALIIQSDLKILTLSTVFSALANYALEYRERRTYLLHKIEEGQRAAVTEASERLLQISMRDPLTGIANRRHYDMRFESAWAEAAQNHQSIALILIDIDHFKRFNDTYGHPAGDACLKRVADVLQASAERHGGSAARLGGEEFAVLLPATEHEAAADIARALLADVRHQRIAHAGSKTADHVTISCGMASTQPPMAGAHDAAARQSLHACADEALYAAKSNGRDRAVDRRLVIDPSTLSVAARGATQVSTQPSSGASASAQEASQLMSLLQRSFRFLRFPDALEKAYQESQARMRRLRLFAASMASVFVYNGYTLTNYDLMPDIAGRLVQAQWMVSCCILLVSALAWWPRTTPAWRELLYTGSVSMTMLLTTWAFAPSQSLTIYAGMVVTVLIPMYGGIAAQLPFKHTTFASLLTLAVFYSVLLIFSPRDMGLLLTVSMTAQTALTFVLLASFALERSERTEFLLTRLERVQSDALARTNEELAELAVRDPLTGIYNRRQFQADLDRIWAEAEGRPVSLLIADVDFFKPYNDNYGHSAGDECLKRLGETLAEIAEREGVMAARLGGEEFGLLLPSRDAAEAERIGQLLREAIGKLHIEHRFSQVADYVTASIGAATLRPAGNIASAQLLSTADEALYEAKLGGRNRVCIRAAGLAPVTLAANPL